MDSPPSANLTPDHEPPSNGAPKSTEANAGQFATDLRNKLKKALLLKDYALTRNFDVPETAITDLNLAARAGEKDKDRDSIEVFADRIDRAIKAITALTYPTTIDTIESDQTKKAVKSFMLRLWLIGGVALVTTITSASIVTSGGTGWLGSFAANALGAFLGLLGCLTYIYFNVLGLVSEKAFNIQDTQANYVRLFLGFMLGWVFYFFFCRDAFEALRTPIAEASTAQSSKGQTVILLLLPFLVGFSTRLVVGILNQAIRAIEMTLGLENKATQLVQRTRQSEPSARRASARSSGI
jgi:hypothetical protein